MRARAPSRPRPAGGAPPAARARAGRLGAALLLAGALAAACAGPRLVGPPPGGPPVRTLLITGFGPFLDVTENPSWEAIRDLEGAQIGSTRIAVARLDVTYAGAARQLDEALARTRPQHVLALGVCRDAGLRLEHVARNLDTSPAPDAAGERRPGERIAPDGPDTLPTRLPLDLLRRALTEAGFEVLDSDDAGGYLCNHLFYELLTRRTEGLAGFVHVPPLQGAWDLPRLRRAVRVVVEVLDRAADAQERAR